MTPNIALEVPIFGLLTTGSTTAQTSALQAASTIECNAAGSYSVGGLTPSPAEVIAAYKHLTINSSSHSSAPSIKIMIRPRGRPDDGHGPDFVYSEQEVEKMEKDIKIFLAECDFLRNTTDNNAATNDSSNDGNGEEIPTAASRHSFIFGALRNIQDSTGKSEKLVVDKATCTRLIRAAEGVPCYFHRAFDDIISSFSPNSSGESFQPALSDLVECGFRGLLTSGGRGNAVENRETIWRMARYISTTAATTGEGEAMPLELLTGGGIRSWNVGPLLRGWPEGVTRGGSVILHSACLKPDDGTFDSDEVVRILKLGA